jgi:3-carboxy-cis,cis-muconate cycloisomerase
MSGEDLWPAPPPAIVEATDASAWIAAMLAVECALAAASEEQGILPAGAASAIADAAASLDLRAADLRAAAEAAGTAVVPLVAALAGATGRAGRWVHHGATSQDILDTALALVARRAGGVLERELAAVAQLLARLASDHRRAVMPGRTLLQQGSPTTFGLKAAGWLVALLDARESLALALRSLPVQLGGAVGTLAVLGERGPAVAAALAARLGLPAPTLPWHTHRVPVARLGSALGIVSGVLGKIARDLVLLAQPEVAEVAERREPGRGASSAMPHKRNPIAAIDAIAAARRAAAPAAALLDVSDHEHERAAGAWQAEAPLVVDLFAHTAHAAASLSRSLDGLAVNAARMRANLDPAGSWAAEALAAELAPSLDRAAAHALVREALERASEGGLAGALVSDARVAPHRKAIEALLGDPLAAAGPVDALIDAALARHAASALAR